MATRSSKATQSARAHAILLLLVAFLVLSVGLQRSLPLIQDADENVFVDAAGRIAATGNLNPGFFGTPGATTIYPLAAGFRIWHSVTQQGQLLRPDPNFALHFQNAPLEYYWLGRYLSVAYALIAVALTFAIGRRSFGAPVGIAAGWLVAFHGIAVFNAKQVRTDSAATAFGLLALWFLLLLLDDATNTRRFLKLQLAAGVAIGIAIASRYYMAVLAAVLLLADAIVLWQSARRRSLIVWMLAGFVAIPFAFLLANPAILPNWQEVAQSLRNETVAEHLGGDGLTPLQNFWWYISNAMPGAITWLQMLAALAGIAVAFRRNRTHTLLLAAFLLVTLVGISISPRHFQRYLIQSLPVVAIFAAVAVEGAALALARWRNSTPRAATLLFAGGLLLLLAYPAARVIRLDIQHSGDDTRILARTWLEANVAPTERVLQEEYGAPLSGSSLQSEDIRSLPDIPNPDAARADYAYWVASSEIYDRYFAEPERYAAQVSLYEALFDSEAQVAYFPSAWYRNGPTIRIFRTAQMHEEEQK